MNAWVFARGLFASAVDEGLGPPPSAGGSSARAEVLSVLIDAHEADPSQQGYLRAMAGIHGATRGGLDDLARELPAKQRRAVSGGAIREALGVSAERFEARMVNRLRQALGK